MSININEATFTGRVTKAPLLATVVVNGENVYKTTASLGIKNERGDDYGFINITLWRDAAVKFSELVTKGMALFVRTTIKSRYDNEKKVTFFDFNVTSWQFVESKEKNEAHRAKAMQEAQQAQQQGGYPQQPPQGNVYNMPQQQGGYPQQPAGMQNGYAAPQGGYPQQPAGAGMQNGYAAPQGGYPNQPQQPTGYAAGAQPSPF